MAGGNKSNSAKAKKRKIQVQAKAKADAADRKSRRPAFNSQPRFASGA
jgi:hypothetical protein